MIMFCEVQLLRQIIATGHMKREDLIAMIMEAFPESDLRRVYNHGEHKRMSVMLKSRITTGKEVECFCKIKGFWANPKKLKMQLVRWLYKNGLSTMDANLVADHFIPEVKRAYSTTPIQSTYSGIFAFTPKTIEREVINKQLGYTGDEREQTQNPMLIEG